MIIGCVLAALYNLQLKFLYNSSSQDSAVLSLSPSYTVIACGQSGALRVACAVAYKILHVPANRIAGFGES